LNDQAVPSPDDADISHTLSEGAAALGLKLAVFQVAQLVTFLRLIARWNRTYNLTAIRDPKLMVSQHLLDCLGAAASLVRRRGRGDGERVLDVGSGAGLPGIVLAIATPEREVVCVDSVGKKAAFITQAISTLRLANAHAVNGRVEAIAAGPFDIVTSRAYAALPDFLASTRRHLGPGAQWMAMKGRPPTDEIAALTEVTVEVEVLGIPDLKAERCLVWMTPVLVPTSVL
jgi:16S rRNA (guanine527-N7)-methyltransferase